MTRLLRGASWTLVGAIGSQVFGFLGGLLTARMLGAEGFGQLSAVRGLLLAFGLFSGAGLGLAAVRYVAEFRDQDTVKLAQRIVFLNRLSWWCAAGTTLVVAGMAYWMASAWLQQDSLRTALWLGAPLVLFNGLSAIQNGILGGLERFKTVASGTLLEACGNFVGVVIGAKTAGINGAIAGACAAATIAWYYRHTILRQELKALPQTPSMGFDKPWLMHEAMPFIVSGALSQPFEWFARLSLVQQPDGFEQMAYFSVAFTCAQVIMFLPRQFTAPGVAWFTSLTSEAGVTIAVQAARLKFKMVMLLGAVVAIPIMLAADFIMRLFGFHSGGDVLVVLVLANLAGVCSGYLRTILCATGKMWRQCAQVLLWCLAMILTWLALDEYGALGLACAYLTAFVVSLLPQGHAARVSLLESTPTTPSTDKKNECP